MVTRQDASLCPQQETNFTGSEAFVWLVVTIVLAITVLLDCALIFYKSKFNRIKKNLKLLEALIKDHDQLVEEENKVESEARRFWDFEDISGILLRLKVGESDWVKSIKEVANEANACIANYEKHSRRLIYRCTTALYMIPIKDVIRKIDDVTREIQEKLDKKDGGAKDIYNSMEKSRSRNRSLLDQYTIEETNKSGAAQHQEHGKPSTSLDELMDKCKDLFSGMEERWSIYLLLPMHAFTKDLSQLKLETETEKLWKREAEALIKEAEVLITNFSRRVSTFSSMRIFGNNIPIVTSGFREEMQRIATEFDGLLERKEKLKFNFIDRAAEKSKLPYQNADNEAIKSALNSIQGKLSKEDKSSKHVAELDSLHKELKGMHDDLQKKEETAVRNACLEQIKPIAQEVEQSLDNFLENQMKEPKLNQIGEAIGRLKKIIDICHIERQESTSVVGLKDDVRVLVSKLISSNDIHLILSIVGMMGVGKTTMAKAVYYDKAVVDHFPIRVWVTETEGADHQVLLMKQDGTKDQTLSYKEVCDYLKETMGLLVLDNVSETDYFNKQEKVKELLSGMAPGSRIVLTTRFKNVALHADSGSTPHQIRLLTKEESWTLFQKVTKTQNQKLEDGVEKLARKVVTVCGGLPLAILCVGCYISAKGMSEDTLLRVLKRINHGIIKGPWEKAWDKNQHELSEAKRNCLYYFTLFPADFEIPARRLINLWVAEGLVEQNKGFDDNQETPEDTAGWFLEELRDWNMIQVVALRSNGKIKTCRLPIMLRDIILQDSNSHSQYSGTHLERRFAYRFDDRGLDANSANVFSKKGIPLSVFFFDKREGSNPGEHMGKILSTGIASEQFMGIRVLDLERIFRPQLPDALSKLIHLKYLGLRWTYLEELPPFIGKLLKLETLDLKHTCIRVLPSSIWKLKKLRNLYLNQNYRSRLEGKPSGNFKENFHTLWGVFVYGSCPLLREINRLKNLRKLKLSFQLKETEQETLSQMIVQLSQLHSLRLRSIGESGGAKILRLRDMSKLEKLSSLKLYGKLEDRLRLPQNLTALTLSASELPYDPMQELQNLPKLESLCLYANSYTGDSMVCHSDSFPRLRVLILWNLENLQEWKVSEGAMPSLKEFEARSCKRLVVPTELKNLKNLRMIKLHEMPKTFMREILNFKKTSLGGIDIVH